MQRHKYTYWTTEELQTLRILRFVEGLPYNEIGIAKRLGIKIPAVDYAIHIKKKSFKG